MRTSTTRGGARLARAVIALLGLALVVSGSAPASAAGYERISGSGSSWAGNAVAQWLADVKAQGITVDYDPNGSSRGRKDFAEGLKGFGVSEIPYTGDTADPQDTSLPRTPFTMMPMVAGGTSFMYNLKIGGERFTDLKLSQAAIAGIFSGQITMWNAPEIAADNPGVPLPPAPITVVVRSEGSGATAQFTLWMLREFPDAYRALCAKTGCNPSNATSYFPPGLPNFVAQNGSSGVTTYSVNTEFTINYDEYSYALQVGFPVAKVKNTAGFYTVPTADAVAVALLQAKINTDPASPNYLAQDLSAVYRYGDPRSYPLSAYSYFIVPAQLRPGFSEGQGATLGYFTQYSLCEGQRTMGALGYSPLPMNLVLAAMTEVRKIPGLDAATIGKLDAVTTGVNEGASGGNPCNNPTFRPGEDPANNVLVETALFPEGCDANCQAPWVGRTSSAAGPVAESAATPNQAQTTDPAAAAAAAAAAPTAVAEEVCDPDTGVCESGSTLDADAASNVQAIPTVLAGQQGWAGPQTLIVLVGLLLCALVLGPPIVTRMVGGGRKVGGGRP